MLAPPIVSQAAIYLTKFLSSNIFLTEKAKDRVTAKGRPSGIATTTTVTQIMKASTISVFQVAVLESDHGSSDID